MSGIQKYCQKLWRNRVILREVIQILQLGGKVKYSRSCMLPGVIRQFYLSFTSIIPQLTSVLPQSYLSYTPVIPQLNASYTPDLPQLYLSFTSVTPQLNLSLTSPEKDLFAEVEKG